MYNAEKGSPTVKTFAFDENLGQYPLRAIDVKAPGTLFVEDVEGNEVDYEFFAPDETNGLAQTTYPYRLEMQIVKVIGDGSGGVGNGSTGTDIALDDLVGLH